LCQVLLDEIPTDLVHGTAAEGLRFADLDESTWEKLPRELIEELAEQVVSRVSAGSARKALEHRHFPRPPEGLRIPQLRLEHRTRLCLAREGFEDNPSLLGDETIGAILAIRAFGPRCLVDLLSALESVTSRDDRLCRSLTMQAERLAELPEAALARRDDPRFGPILSEVDLGAATAKELADRLLSRVADPPDPEYVTEKIRQLQERILAMPQWPLEEELKQIFASTPHERNREIVIGYYGWGDGQRHTLAEIGARYGMTRERTRQICAKLVKRKDPSKIPAPVMDRTLEFVRERLPCAVAGLERALREAGLTATDLRLENVQDAAELLGRDVPFRVVSCARGRLAVKPSQMAVPPVVAEAAKKEIYYHGANTVGHLVELLSERFPGCVEPALVAESLQLLEGFRWLDRESGWFRLESVAKHGLPKAIDKALAVAGRLRARDLASAVTRNRRVWRSPPPENVLLEYCRQSPGLRVDGEWIVADPPHPWQEALTGVEAQLVGILKEHGPVMERGELEDLCVGKGMNRFSFHAFLASSPVIAQYGHSVYGLLGAAVAPEWVKSLVSKHRAERAPARVLDQHGETEDGRIWLGYRLSKAASTYAVITVPAALKDVVQGKFDLLTPDGRHVGVLAAKDGRAWGLGAFLRQQQAKIDDYLLVTLDLEKRQAVIAIDGGLLAAGAVAGVLPRR
jgi:hypothetical protein